MGFLENFTKSLERFNEFIKKADDIVNKAHNGMIKANEYAEKIYDVYDVYKKVKQRISYNQRLDNLDKTFAEEIKKSIEHGEYRLVSGIFIEDEAKNKLDKTKPSDSSKE